MANTRRKLRACALVALLLAGCKTQGEWGKYEHRQYLPSVSQLRDSPDDGFYFAFPVGIERRRFALLALESLNIGSGVTIRPTDPSFYTSVSSVLPPGYGAFVGSLGELRIGDGAVVGSVYAWGNGAELGQRVSAAGYIKHVAAPFESGARATLGVLKNRADAVARYTFVSPLDPVTNSAPSRRTGKAGSPPLEVAPGTYKEIVALEGTTLRLSSGSYRVRALRIGQDAVLEIANSDGPVDIWVERDFVMQGTLEEQLLVPNILLIYSGRQPLVLSQPFRGTLVAPRADVTLQATDPPHVGAFYARRLRVAPKTSIRHVTFYRNLRRATPLAEVCDKCEVSVEADLTRCQVGFQQQEQHRDYAECVDAARARFQRCALGEHWRPGSWLDGSSATSCAAFATVSGR